MKICQTLIAMALIAIVQLNAAVEVFSADDANIIEMDIRSDNKGEILYGTFKYSGSSYISFLGTLSEDDYGNNVSVQNKFGDDWRYTGDWVIGGRDGQHVVKFDVKSDDNGKTLNGTMSYTDEGEIRVRAKRSNGVAYAVHTHHGGPILPGGVWVLGNRGDRQQYLVEIDIHSNDDGKTFSGTVTYAGEGPVPFRATHVAINSYRGEVYFGDDWHSDGDWLIGSRDKRAVMVSAKSTDGGKTMSGIMEYLGEDPQGLEVRVSGSSAYTVENQWGSTDSPWSAGGVYVLGDRQVTVPSAAPQMPGKVVAWGGWRVAELPKGLNEAIAIAGGKWYNLALKPDGTVVGWGGGQPENNFIPEGLSGVTAIALGYEHGLALKQNGTVVVWGKESITLNRDLPDGLSNVVAIDAGSFHNLALKEDGTVVAWGTNRSGQLDIPAGLSGVIAIGAGRSHSLALKGDGTVVAWGGNEEGQTDIPAGLKDVIAIAAGNEHNLALKRDGTVVAWGSNKNVFGEQGQAKVPAGLSDVTAIAAGSFHSMALKQDGTVVAWGSNDFGETVIPDGLSNVTAISAGEQTCLTLVSIPAATHSANVTNTIGMEFKLIPAGKFMMGSPESEEGRSSDEDLHEVQLTQDYYLGVTEVTQSQWQQVMGTTPWKGEERAKEGDDYAASYISWNDAVKFCEELSKKEGRTYRLPTEAEWEYACRGGSTTRFYFGDNASELDHYEFYFDSTANSASIVKQKKPNGFGLYDMIGNVKEFCQDWYTKSLEGPVTNPTGPASGTRRVMRGGSFATRVDNCRSAYRGVKEDLDDREAYYGLRVVLVPDKSSDALTSNKDSEVITLDQAMNLFVGKWKANHEEFARMNGIDLTKLDKDSLDRLKKEISEVSLEIDKQSVEAMRVEKIDGKNSFRLINKSNDLDYLEIQFLTRNRILFKGRDGSPDFPLDRIDKEGQIVK
ncbi:MAG: SUMF1/EgtB/PvdO family nonheme iron enzyme [Planctomycetaceae bacterium]|nr:SUMF1/EgtB/PvdO family nonheme iron enzyme [Planctomycetaceae bacterium]